MRNILGIGLFLVVVACTKSVRIEKPTDLIPRDIFVQILTEISLLETHVQTTYTHVSEFKGVMVRSGKKILDKYHVSPEQYESSMDFYASDQEEMKSMYNEVLNALNLKSSRY
jgi:hypothetical protein